MWHGARQRPAVHGTDNSFDAHHLPVPLFEDARSSKKRITLPPPHRSNFLRCGAKRDERKMGVKRVGCIALHWSHPSSVPDGTSAPAVVPSLLRTTNKARMPHRFTKK